MPMFTAKSKKNTVVIRPQQETLPSTRGAIRVRCEDGGLGGGMDPVFLEPIGFKELVKDSEATQQQAAATTTTEVASTFASVVAKATSTPFSKHSSQPVRKVTAGYSAWASPTQLEPLLLSVDNGGACGPPRPIDCYSDSSVASDAKEGASFSSFTGVSSSSSSGSYPGLLVPTHIPTTTTTTAGAPQKKGGITLNGLPLNVVNPKPRNSTASYRSIATAAAATTH